MINPFFVRNCPNKTVPNGASRFNRCYTSTLLITASPGAVELEWPFTEDTARGLLDFILFERVCCTSFRDALDFPPPHSTIRLRITAPPEQVEALQALYR